MHSTRILLTAAVIGVGATLAGCPEDEGLEGSWIRTVMSDVDGGVSTTISEIYKFKDDGEMSVVNELSAWGNDWQATVRWWANGHYAVSGDALQMNFQGVLCQDMGAKIVTTGTIPNPLPGDLSSMLDAACWPSGWLLEAFEDLMAGPIAASCTVDGDTLSITVEQQALRLFTRFNDNFNYDNPTETGCD